MPNEARHLSQAEKNERLSHAIASLSAQSEPFTDWEVTSLFYSALHLVDAFFDHSQGYHPKGHQDRAFLISKATQLRSISVKYLDLYQRSLDARYRLIPINPAQVSNITQNNFQPIKSHIRSLIT